MKDEIKICDWVFSDISNVTVSKNNGELSIENRSSDKVKINCNKSIFVKDKYNKLYLNFKGKVENSGGYLTINEGNHVPINSEILMPLKDALKLDVSITVAANSKIEIGSIFCEFIEDRDLVNEMDTETDTLILVPDYPSYYNLYNCAFAHSRNKEYVKSGLKIQVVAVNECVWYQTKYIKDDIPVLKCSFQDLKKILQKHQHKVVITHFVDEKFYSIFDGNIFNNQKMIFICHGPETVYRYLVNKTRPYFTAPCKEPIINNLFDLKDKYVKLYSQKDNVEWVFVSDWLKEFSEEQQHLKFKHSRVINNIMDEDLFPYSPKTKDDRKKILVVRKFDNICQHSLDQVVMCILELSRRDIFSDLEFEIYGDGNYYDELVEPIKNLSNVHLYRRFIPNEKLNEIYKSHGIMLLPSRHDAHAVSMGESASTGMVVVGSNVTSNPYFMNEKENHTLADPEDYVELANIIERLYNDPLEFLRISENMSKFTRKFNKENTVKKEVELIKKSLENYDSKPIIVSKKPIKNPILTIGVPAYNVQDYIEKCLFSLLNHENAYKTEIIVINDGSKDETANKVLPYEKYSNGIVRLINKENGGHGSTINTAIKEARGKYFRLIDGDDWVDSLALKQLVDIMETSDSDIILNKGSYEYIEDAEFTNIIDYDNMLEGKVYKFEDLTYDNYGFKKYGPLLTTGNYKTELLRQANFEISEKKPYVDMEFNAFSLKCIDTITYYNIDLYRYLIGREGQTVSRDFWKKKYQDHKFIIFNILKKVTEDKALSPRKVNYILNHIIAPMVDSQVFMYDTLCKWRELDEFLSDLRKYDEAYVASMNYIENLDGNSWLILNYYKRSLKKNSNKSIIIPGVVECMDDLFLAKGFTLKRVVKALTPYGLIALRRKLKSKRIE